MWMMIGFSLAASIASAMAVEGNGSLSGTIVVGSIEYAMVKPATGAVARLKLPEPLRDLAPWPDRLSFVASNAQWSGSPGVLRVRLVGKDVVLNRLTSGEHFFPAISWDARMLVYEEGHELWVEDLASGQHHIVLGARLRPGVETSTDLRTLSPPYSLGWSQCVWLPGDRTLLAAYSQSLGLNTAFSYVAFKGKRFRGRMLCPPGVPCFNTGGTCLAWVGKGGRAWVAEWSSNLGARGARALPVNHCESVAWSPDNKYLAVGVVVGAAHRIYLWSSRTKRIRLLAKLGDLVYSTGEMVWLRT